MKRKLILKFDIKDSTLRCDMYQAESVRIEGRAKAKIGNVINKGTAHHIIVEILSQFDKEFHIKFNENYNKNIKSWVKENIFKVYIRDDVFPNIREAIYKTLSNNVIIIKD